MKLMDLKRVSKNNADKDKETKNNQIKEAKEIWHQQTTNIELEILYQEQKR